MSKGKAKWRELDVKIWRCDFKRRKGEELSPLEAKVLEAWDATGNKGISDMFDMSAWVSDGQIIFRDRGYTEQAKFLEKIRNRNN